MKIPVCKPILTGGEWQLVKECLDTNWISGHGKYVDEFEQKFSRFCGAKFGTACTSGTAALHLALAACGIKKDDEVIIPTFNIISLANAVLWTGATPVLVDSEPDTGNIDVNKIEQKITPRTKAIVPAHMYGHPCNMDPILKLADKYKLWIIEDAAEAHGAEYKNKKAGSLGHLGCFSFYPNKIITTGEGGMVTTNDPILDKRLKHLKDLAFTKPRYIHPEIGFNYRMTNVTAAIGVAQMEKIDELVEKRRQIAAWYNELFKDIPYLNLPVGKNYAKSVFWMYAIQIKDNSPLSKQELQEKLHAENIETRDCFYPMHLQPCYKKIGLFQNEKYPVSEKLYQHGLVLPSAGDFSKQEIEYVAQTIKDICGQRPLLSCDLVDQKIIF